MDYESRNNTKRPINPYASAGRLSRLTFWWLRNLLRLGLKRELGETDIYECLDEQRSSKLSSYFEQVWREEQCISPENPRIYMVLLKIYAKKFLWLGVFHNFLDLIIKILLPQCLGGLVIYFSQEKHEVSINVAVLYAFTIVMGSAIVAISFHGKMTYCNQIEQRIRLTCVSVIYKKVLRMSKSMSVDGLNGQVITLMSNDVNRLIMFLAFLHVLWKGPLMVVVLGYFIYLEIGWYGMVGIGFLLLLLPLLIYLGKHTAKIRGQTAQLSGQRVRFMNEIVQAMEMIKMYTWEKPFATIVGKIRENEIKSVRMAMLIRLMYLMSRVFANISIFLSLITYVYFGNTFSARKVYIVTAYMHFMFTWMVYYWCFTIEFNASAWVSLNRIRDFLLLPENKSEVESLNKKSSDKTRNGHSVIHTKEEVDTLITQTNIHKPIGLKINRRTVRATTDIDAPQIQFTNATASWLREGRNGTCTGIENVNLDITNSSICGIIGTVGSGKSTSLQVLLGELELDAGSLSITGNMSYAPQEPWLFNGSVRKNIVFTEEFDEERYMEVVRVCALEKDFELLKFGDKTIVGERGNNLSGGQRARVNLARAVYRKADIYLLDDPLSAVDSRVGNHIFKNCIAGFLKNKICILVTHQLQYLKLVDHIVLMDAGQIHAHGSLAEIRSVSNHPLLNGIEDTDNDSIDQESEETVKMIYIENAGVQVENKEAPCVKLQGLQLYTQYLSAVNNHFYVALVFGMLFLSQWWMAYMDVYISKWSTWEDSIRLSRENTSINTNTTSSLEQDVVKERHRHLTFYVSGTAAVLIIVILRNISLFEMCMMASRNLHDRMFRGITRAWMSFFNANPSGRILNRFSKDMDTIDLFLPHSLFELLTFAAELLSMLYLISYWSLWMMIPNLMLLMAFVWMRRAYIGCARPFQNFVALTRSPILAHTNATLQGLTTIRAFNSQRVMAEELDAHVDHSTSVGYIFLTVTRAYILWVELVCCMYMALILGFYLAMGNDGMGSQVGLAIIQMLNMSTVSQFMLRQQTELEAHMLSVQRVDEYACVEHEPPLETETKHKPSDTWPSKGNIEMRGLYMRYTESGQDVLHDINLQIHHQEKIGIVGRTGAGKSSIVQALFRLAHNRGSVRIDGIDTSTLGLHDLRRKISIIPQNPVLFSGTMRHNLDPFNEVEDEAIWNALNMVALKDTVAAMSGGLDARLTDGGSNFSMGQRQLVCLARAMLRNNRILVLDEATSNVDAETDRLIQNSIRDRFGHCTVLTIAHRLHTVMDSDRVLVVDAGRAIEFDHPAVLLQNAESHFSEMVRQTGNDTEQILRNLAEKSFAGFRK